MNEIEQQAAEITRQIFEQVWLGRDFSALDQFYHEDCKIHGMIEGYALSRSEYREAIEQYLEVAELVSYEIHDSLISGDRVAQRMTLNILSHATGITAPQTSSHFGRLQDGKMIEIHVQFSMLEFFEKQGLLPPNSALLMITGEKLA